MPKFNVLKCIVPAALIAASGCATSTPIAAAFDPAEISWFSAQGSNTIQGSAVMRTRGGDAKTCAANTAELVPDSTYARERMQALYGSLEGGYNPLFMGRRISERRIPPQYDAASREAQCDALGQFLFEGVPDGTYFLITEVSWSAGNSFPAPPVYQGGWLMRRVTVSGGETARVVLTPSAHP